MDELHGILMSLVLKLGSPGKGNGKMAVFGKETFCLMQQTHLIHRLITHSLDQAQLKINKQISKISKKILNSHVCITQLGEGRVALSVLCYLSFMV
jgi:hypothetical protein